MELDLLGEKTRSSTIGRKVIFQRLVWKPLLHKFTEDSWRTRTTMPKRNVTEDRLSVVEFELEELRSNMKTLQNKLFPLPNLAIGSN